jgi:signal transduction histidine kinase
MTVVKGYASMIYDGSFETIPEKVKDTAVQIKEVVDRLVSLVDDFLNLRKIEEGKMEYQFKEINIIKLIKSIVEELKIIAEKEKLNLAFECPKTNPEKIIVKADEQKLRQVIQNLVENAIKYTDKCFVRIELKEDKNSVVISITDSGRGISNELLPNLFKQFSRDSSVKKIQGTGLGLYIAKEIIKAHHGKIWAESEGEGKGAKFCVRLSKHQN